MTVFTIALIFIMILLFSWQSLFSRIQANNYPGSEADAFNSGFNVFRQWA